MLPGPDDGAVSLADVLRDCLSAVSGAPNRLGLGPVDRAAVILVDGLGAENLRARAGHARTLSSAMSGRATIATGVPTTTAAALATLATGALPGQHGIVGYTALEPVSDTVVNQLRGWDEGLLPVDWQRMPTLFETAGALGLESIAIGSPRYRDSGFTRTVLAGARYVPAASIEDRLEALGDALSDRSWRGIAYAYIPELDMAAHERGWESDAWIAGLERTDAATAGLAKTLGSRSGVLLTADHGILDVPEHRRLVIPDSSPLWTGVRLLAGEHRMLHLHLEVGVDPRSTAASWEAAYGGEAWVATRDDAIDAGWFGPVAEEVRSRIGDVLVAARKAVAFYTEAAFAGHAGRMIGQHGSWTDAEVRVPLLRFGAFG
jgi:hypothetical protein